MSSLEGIVASDHYQCNDCYHLFITHAMTETEADDWKRSSDSPGC